jgi:hypothetical protein
MASLYKASCKCGYENQVLIGGTRMMAGKCFWPALCGECGKLGSCVQGIEVDVPVCGRCKSPNIVLYRGETGFKLEGLHLCPQCKELSLRFEDTSGDVFC